MCYYHSTTARVDDIAAEHTLLLHLLPMLQVRFTGYELAITTTVTAATTSNYTLATSAAAALRLYLTATELLCLTAAI